MKLENGRHIFSPSDLTVFLKSPFSSWMDRLYLDHREESPQPDEADASARLIQKLGIDHESTFLRTLAEANKDICQIADGTDRFERTAAALKEGREIIYQGWLKHQEFAGAADFIVRVAGQSALGSYHYEVWDTKLAVNPRPYFIIQLLCYAEMLEQLQGIPPEYVRVVPGRGEKLSFRTEDFKYFYRQLKQTYLEFQASFDRHRRPLPTGFEDFCKWSAYAVQPLAETDHLSLVANITSSQICKLEKSGITTMSALANARDTPVPARLDMATWVALRQQARLQVKSAGRDSPLFEVVEQPAQAAGLPPQRRGLATLPPPSPLDICFDMEGYPYVDGGLEYLFGVTLKQDGELAFKDWWAHDAIHEKKAFEEFIDWAHARWRRDPGMHIYHYGAYEVSAVKRLMSRYGSRERDVDDLLRNQVFVDLYKIVRQGLKVGEPGYSLKNIEHIYRGKRAAGVATAVESVVEYQRWLVTGDGDTWKNSAILRAIRDYNREDCDSTWQLLDWLRGEQEKHGIEYLPAETGERTQDKDKAQKPASEAELLATALLGEIPEDRTGDCDRWRLQELFAWLLEFHYRELRPVYWKMYERGEMSEQQLAEDIDCLAAMDRVSKHGRPADPGNKKVKSVLYDYKFDPDQDTKLTSGKRCFLSHDLKLRCDITNLDPDRGTVTIKLGPQAPEPPVRLSLIPDEIISPDELSRSILRTVNAWRERKTLPKALEDFLLRRRPAITSNMEGEIIKEGSDQEASAIEAICNLTNSALCIQGPPGSGKTHLASLAIIELLRRGKRVGIASNSHEAVINLMDRVAGDAREENVHLSALKTKTKENHSIFAWNTIRPVASGKEAFARDSLEFNLIGGSAWDFSCECASGKLDYLFVDEAGQVSVANLVAMAPCAGNLVLLGDQMQLSQPLKGSHPGDSGRSSLEYLLDDNATISPAFGIFLGITRRLHPEICDFISASIYDSRLHCQPDTAKRVLHLPSGGCSLLTKKAGILFIPCRHEGNTQSSDEEVDVIAQLYKELLQCTHTDRHGLSEGLLKPDDILIVAPYNMQVRRLQTRIPQATVGSVDKFQGKGAPVVIISMCASDGNSSPRGLEFLFSRNRLNVAISRAQSLAVIVANPNLASTDCQTPEQMRLVNLFCKIVEAGS